MPRMARQKSHDAIYHIMCRSISEVDLFQDEDDKLKYLSLVKKYQKIHEFRVYGYCLMDNHVHMIIDANGADISTIMHGINYSYAGYFNYHHKRHGHLFQDRFKSKIVKTDSYLLALSAYIHNNPVKLKGYENCPEKYKFSSLAIYLGLKQDPYELVEDGFIMSMFGKTPKTARRNYMKLVYSSDNKILAEDAEFINEKTEYRSQRYILIRDADPEKIIEFISKKMNVPHIKLHIKNGRDRNLIEAKALFVVLMRGLCNAKCGNICRVLGSISQARASTLCSLGVELIDTEKYKNIVEEYLKFEAA